MTDYTVFIRFHSRKEFWHRLCDVLTVSSVLLLVIFNGCMGIKQKIQRIPLDSAMSDDILMAVEERQTAFGDCRGRFTARLEKPGVDMTFQGLFLIEGRGNSRIEIYSPFGTVLHLFSLSQGTFIYRNIETIVEGNAFEELAEIKQMWGLALRPYQIQTLMSGPYIDPYFYTIDPAQISRIGDRIEVVLLTVRDEAPELLLMDRSASFIYRREIRQIRTNRDIVIDYEYNEEKPSSDVALNEKFPYPKKVTVRNIHGRVTLSIVFSNVCGSRVQVEETVGIVSAEECDE